MESWIDRDDEIKGGEPVVRGSRVSVYVIAERVARGEDPSVLAEDFPHIPANARAAAVAYARAHPRKPPP